MTWAWCEDCDEWHICTNYPEWTEWGWWPHFRCLVCALARLAPKARAAIKRILDA